MYKRYERAGTLLGIIALSGLFGWVAYTRQDKPNGSGPGKTGMALTSQAVAPPTRADVLSRLEINNRRFSGTNGDPFTASFTLDNKNDFPIKDFTIRFTFHGNSGSMISSRSQSFYEIVPAKQGKAIRNARLGFMPNQGVSVSAEVIDYGIP